MFSIENLTFRWLEECGRIDPIYPQPTWVLGHQPRISRVDSWGLRISADGHLVYFENKRETELARFVGERRLLNQRGGALLLNGNGLTGNAQNIQAALRERVRSSRSRFKVSQTMIIPYQALTGAQITYDTILLINVTADGEVPNKLEILVPPKSKRPNYRNASGAFNYPFIWEERRWQLSRTWRQGGIHLMLMHAPLNGQQRWHRVTESRGAPAFITERIHHLGASVFSAVGPDQQRHRYISAFDNQEQTPMYFLAQLPDEGEVTSYSEAIHLLAPPIVHKARAEGKRVYRQGDVFAIESEIYERHLKDAVIARRDAGIEGTRLKIDRRSKLRKQLMIYGTGHTATIVAVKPNGVTFIRGVMTHDPVLEQAGRTREHQNIVLNPQEKWFLCVRNQVPRAAPSPPREEQDGNSNKAEDGAVRVRGDAT